MFLTQACVSFISAPLCMHLSTEAPPRLLSVWFPTLCNHPAHGPEASNNKSVLSRSPCGLGLTEGGVAVLLAPGPS